ncbi:hypothetical protein C7120_08990 [Prevotella sp. oral taxon 376]|uniref:hypothetical protein n=1 Tax=Prevotella sp. oral taxon 376 TaxID=712466 RepID=UPI000D1EA4F6|nr:hypothetical protein [Prevotella sp. oral taxon 376]PTL34625.1 hypothetical protein C7120_08990 [Prevotella sp. oral taxon 376]
MEKKFAFVICVNGRPMRTFKWCCRHEEEIVLQAASMCMGARCFKKTAAVLVYELQGSMFKLIHSVQWRNEWEKVKEFPSTAEFCDGRLLEKG